MNRINNLMFMRTPQLKVDVHTNHKINKKVIKCKKDVEVMDNFGMNNFEKLKVSDGWGTTKLNSMGRVNGRA